MNIATFFSGGFGSAEFAFKYINMNHNNVVACEIDKFARESYINNHECPNFYEDVNKFVEDREGLKFRGDIDFVHLSPPCQEFSKLGCGIGFDGDRGKLSLSPIPIIKDINPKYFIIENVSALATQSKFKDGFDYLIEQLKKLGFDVEYFVLNSKDFLIPQSRNRVFILGSRVHKIGRDFNYSGIRFNLAHLLDLNVVKKYYIKQGTRDYLYNNPSKTFKFVPTNINDINSDTYISTITASYGRMGRTNPFIIDNGGLRRLTINECVRLMGDYNEYFIKGKLSDTQLYKILGNAIDIQLYSLLLKFLLKTK